MKNNINLIPLPQCCKFGSTESLAVSKLNSYFVAPAFGCLESDIADLTSTFHLNWQKAAGADNANVRFELCDGDHNEGYTLKITADGVVCTASTINGARYAANSLKQLLFTALIIGPKDAALPCGVIQDQPRFGWRSFLLDSTRHFQTTEFICNLLNKLAQFRVNRFHWHLTDNQAWRIDCSPEFVTPDFYLNNPGCYSAADIAKVADHAESLGIEIVPELDIPGHSKTLLMAYPNLGCKDGATAPNELCVGSPETRDFVKKLIVKVLELFPKSRYIHIGGDEAETAHWEKCPVCQKAMQEKGLKTVRELEHDFMLEMTRVVVEHGRTPIVWGICSDLTYPVDTIIQCWLDIREPLRVAANGNKTIYSVHSSLYFDYPENPWEPHESWMFELTSRGVYMTDPHIIWPEQVKDSILGVEACLWTETVPEWRVENKIMPRLPAYSEVAWSDPAKKTWSDFQDRECSLRAAGYLK